jgi:hypothetical protein
VEDGGELALVDIREELIFSQGHLLLARSAPLSRLELKFAELVPRHTIRIVLCDGNDGLAERASNRWPCEKISSSRMSTSASSPPSSTMPRSAAGLTAAVTSPAAASSV